MARVNTFILEYGERLKAGVDLNTTRPPKKTMQRFIRFLRPVTDERLAGMIDYPLHEIVVIVFIATLGGASTWHDMEQFGYAYEKWFRKFLRLANGIPSHDTFRRVFGLIKTEQLEAATVGFIADVLTRLKTVLKLNNTDVRHICVDGKESRGTGRKRDTSEAVRNLQTLHIYDNSHGICLYSRQIENKTNEIPVAQSILGSMDLCGSIVTFDAMNTQKKTIAIIREQKGDYIGALKGNHEIMDGEVSDYFTNARCEQIRVKGVDYCRSSERLGVSRGGFGTLAGIMGRRELLYRSWSGAPLGAGYCRSAAEGAVGQAAPGHSGGTSGFWTLQGLAGRAGQPDTG